MALGESKPQILEKYGPYVRSLAAQVRKQFNSQFEMDELVAWGQIGLLEAAERFDARVGANFLTFAHYRIKGAIYDGLRREFGAHVPSQLTSEEIDSSLPDVFCGDAAYADGGPDELLRFADELAPDHLVWIAELRGLVDEAMESLLPIEREVLRHHYFLDKPIVDLAGARNLSKSWLSRVHTRALAKLRHEFGQRFQQREVAS